MQMIDIQRGDSPLILTIPHAGTHVPDDVYNKLNNTGKALADTDWHVEKLYQGLAPNATCVRANFHRYVIDANRDPEGESLYTGKNTTGLCPLVDFKNQKLYKKGLEPNEKNIATRLADFHTPYHRAIADEVARLKEKHGLVLIYDCHSIRSEVPFLFEGELPHFNIGSDNGRTCGAEYEMEVVKLCQQAQNYSNVVNGRFRGGWTVRHFGEPENGVHAIQMELAQRAYLDETAAQIYRPALAAPLRQILGKILQSLESLAYYQAKKLEDKS